MISCTNCGHESHCGDILKKDLQGQGEAIEICKNCICELCKDEDKLSQS